MLTTDAFPNLASFAQDFSGGFMKMDDPTDPEYGLTMHVSGYRNADYDAKIEAAFAVKDDPEARAALLHEAEEMLMADMPVAPLVQLQSGVLIHDDFTKVKDTYWGFNYFTKVVLKNRYNYDETLPPETEEEE
jgi:ABC-type oligopeptide transport system substrate-binding subunit